MYILIRFYFAKLIDMLKLMHFKGCLVIDYDDNFEVNVNTVRNWLITNKFSTREVTLLSDKHEDVSKDNYTDTLIDV